MQSPLKGLERLSEELRVERQKAGDALQDLTRLRIQVATLAQSNDEKDATIEELRNACTQEQNEADNLRNELVNLEADYNCLRESTSQHDMDYQHIYDDKLTLQSECDTLNEILHEKEGQIAALTVKCNSLEGRGGAKDELLNKLKTEIQELREGHTVMEQEKLDILEELKKVQAWNEDLKVQLGSFEIMSDGYDQTRTSNDDLRAQLDAAQKAHASCLEQVRELNGKIKDKLANEVTLEDTIRQLRQEKELFLKDLRDVESNRDQISDRVQAEINASEAAKERAEAAARGREFLDRQLHELQEKERETLRYNATLEEQLTLARTDISELQGEISTLREKLVQSESAVEQVSGMQAMVMEMDLLRAQLNDVRRQLLKRGVEDEAGVMAPQAIMNREEQSRLTYEGIIHQLRMDIQQTNAKYHETSRRLEEALREAHRVPALVEEIQIYKEMNLQASQESQSVALSVTEEKNRALRATQEKSNLQHQLHRAEAELVSARAEIKRSTEEVAAQRERAKEFNTLKIAAQKKVAEYNAENSRLETLLEDAKQKLDTCSLELEKTKRTVHEQTFTISDLRIKITEVENLKSDGAALSSKLVALKAEFSHKEKNLTLQVEELRHQKATMERELIATRDKVSFHRNSFEQSHYDTARVRSELEAVTTERDRLKRQIADNESQQAEQHLFELKRDLEQTVHEFHDLEKEKSVKDKVIQQITAECSKEREKVALLKLQMSTLEDRLRVANQELSVYRGIDVYQSSMQAQLQSYRKDRSYNDTSLDNTLSRSRQYQEPATTEKTERDLGSAFANSLNFNSAAARPSSRTSNAASYLEGSERDQHSNLSSRSASPVQNFSRTAPAARPDLNKPSSPILRPAALSVTAPARSQQVVGDRSSAGKFTLRDMETHYQSHDELDAKSVVSDLASHHSHHEQADYRRAQDTYVVADEYKGEGNNAKYASGVYPQNRPLSRSNSNSNLAATAPVIVNANAGPSASELMPAPGAISESERQELLRRRAERKALRDQQLRERILREGNLGSSFGARGGDVRDDMSQSSQGSAASNRSRTQPPPAPASYAARDPAASGTRRNTVAEPAPARANPVLSSSRAQSQRSSLPVGGASSTPAATTGAASAAPSSVREAVAYRPAKTDFARARRLLSM